MKQTGFFHSFHEPHFHFERSFKYPVRSFSACPVECGTYSSGVYSESQVTLSRVEGERVVKYFFQLRLYSLTNVNYFMICVVSTRRRHDYILKGS